MESLVAAREADKIRFIGFTGHTDPEVHLGMLETAKRHRFRFDTVQNAAESPGCPFSKF